MPAPNVRPVRGGLELAAGSSRRASFLCPPCLLPSPTLSRQWLPRLRLQRHASARSLRAACAPAALSAGGMAEYECQCVRTGRPAACPLCLFHPAAKVAQLIPHSKAPATLPAATETRVSVAVTVAAAKRHLRRPPHSAPPNTRPPPAAKYCGPTTLAVASALPQKDALCFRLHEKHVRCARGSVLALRHACTAQLCPTLLPAACVAPHHLSPCTARQPRLPSPALRHWSCRLLQAALKRCLPCPLLRTVFMSAHRRYYYCVNIRQNSTVEGCAHFGVHP